MGCCSDVVVIGIGSRCIYEYKRRSLLIGLIYCRYIPQRSIHSLQLAAQSLVLCLSMRSILYLAAAALPLTQGVRIIQSNDDGWSEANLRYESEHLNSQTLLTKTELSLTS